MEQLLKEDTDLKNKPLFQFLNEEALAALKEADANPLIKISTPDKSIPFIVLSDGGVIADITAKNPMALLKNIRLPIPVDNAGAGFIDIYHGNKILVFRHVESRVFTKKWLVNNVASALQSELNLYYPSYKIRSR